MCVKEKKSFYTIYIINNKDCFDLISMIWFCLKQTNKWRKKETKNAIITKSHTHTHTHTHTHARAHARTHAHARTCCSVAKLRQIRFLGGFERKSRFWVSNSFRKIVPESRCRVWEGTNYWPSWKEYALHRVHCAQCSRSYVDDWFLMSNAQTTVTVTLGTRNTVHKSQVKRNTVHKSQVRRVAVPSTQSVDMRLTGRRSNPRTPYFVLHVIVY